MLDGTIVVELEVEVKLEPGDDKIEIKLVLLSETTTEELEYRTMLELDEAIEDGYTVVVLKAVTVAVDVR